jgi:hypothetical protein
MRIEAVYQGRDKHGHFMFQDVTGDIERSHLYLNGEFSNFPEEIPPRSRVRFFVSPHFRGPKPTKYTDAREVQVIA